MKIKVIFDPEGKLIKPEIIEGTPEQIIERLHNWSGQGTVKEYIIDFTRRWENYYGVVLEHDGTPEGFLKAIDYYSKINKFCKLPPFFYIID